MKINFDEKQEHTVCVILGMDKFLNSIDEEQFKLNLAKINAERCTKGAGVVLLADLEHQNGGRGDC